jgi:hypothetical protein
MRAHIAVTKAIERKFPAVDEGHELSITIPQRIERSVTLTLVPHRPTHPSRLFLKRGLYMDRSQSRQMPLGGRPTHFGTPIKVGHASAQDAPLLGTAGVILCSTKAAKLSGFVNRCFHTQHAALVVELKRVLIQCLTRTPSLPRRRSVITSSLTPTRPGRPQNRSTCSAPKLITA